jgi:hypothetical protein
VARIFVCHALALLIQEVPKGLSVMIKGLRSAGFEFELGRTSLVRVWDSRGFTHLLKLIKCVFSGWDFLNKKKTY